MISLPIFAFHIEPTNICTLKCPGCARTRFLERWTDKWQNHYLDENDLDRFLDLDLDDIDLHLCGNYGDPIYHPRLVSLISIVKNRGARIALTTNGSHRSKEWWLNLCKALDHRDRIVFSIDGTPENFTNYRINADWKTISEAIDVCVGHNIKCIWKFIPFSYNQHDIDDTAQLAKNLGMDFEIAPSDRFDEKTQHLTPDPSLINWRSIGIKKFHEKEKILVDPSCYHGKEYFITATGHFSPCCFVADHRFYYKTIFGKERNRFDIRTQTFSEIMQNHKVRDFYQTITQVSPAVCQFNCPSKNLT